VEVLEGLTFVAFAQIVQGVGTVAVLAWLVWQFHRGTIVPKAVADEMIEVYRNEAEKTFQAILEKFDNIIVVCPLGFTSHEIREAVKTSLKEE
jgi:hypothetical protein